MEENMRRIKFVFCTCLAVSQLSTCNAAEPGIDPETVLQKWEAASRGVRSWSASFTRLEYDGVFKSSLSTSRGRLYWEVAGMEFYKIEGSFLTARDDAGVLTVDYRARTYVQTPKAEIERIRQQYQSEVELSWWQRFSRDFARGIAGDVTIEECLPLSTYIDAAAIPRTIQMQCPRGRRGDFSHRASTDRVGSPRVSAN